VDRSVGDIDFMIDCCIVLIAIFNRSLWNIGVQDNSKIEGNPSVNNFNWLTKSYYVEQSIDILDLKRGSANRGVGWIPARTVLAVAEASGNWVKDPNSRPYMFRKTLGIGLELGLRILDQTNKKQVPSKISDMLTFSAAGWLIVPVWYCTNGKLSMSWMKALKSRRHSIKMIIGFIQGVNIRTFGNDCTCRETPRYDDYLEKRESKTYNRAALR